MNIRVRFAPSPTGFLHLGGARTAFYNYLFAKKNKASFILRIEDTDLLRSTPEAVQAIHDGMNWLGLKPDEGPFYQTKRFTRYQEVIEKWLEEGVAYRCNCSAERLEQVRANQSASGEKPRYDGHCRNLNLSEDIGEHVVRFKNPLEGAVIVEDYVHGTVIFENKELDDLIIARSDGTPTYNFTVVVDDADMDITHVIRGDDHLNNTPRQLNMFVAMGKTPPKYAHIPMILGSDGKKLSKRHGAVSVMEYRDQGYLPEALLNYLVRLGWSHGDQEIFNREELINYFSLDHLSKSPGMLNLEKLTWLNQHYLKTLPENELIEPLKWHFDKLKIDLNSGPDLISIIKVQRDRCKTLKEMAENSAIFYQEKLDHPFSITITPAIKCAIDDLVLHLKALTIWDLEALKKTLEDIVQNHELKFVDLGKPLRALLVGNKSNLPIYSIFYLFGKDKTLNVLASLNTVEVIS